MTGLVTCCAHTIVVYLQGRNPTCTWEHIHPGYQHCIWAVTNPRQYLTGSRHTRLSDRKLKKRVSYRKMTYTMERDNRTRLIRLKALSMKDMCGVYTRHSLGSGANPTPIRLPFTWCTKHGCVYSHWYTFNCSENLTSGSNLYSAL